MSVKVISKSERCNADGFTCDGCELKSDQVASIHNGHDEHNLRRTAQICEACMRRALNLIEQDQEYVKYRQEKEDEGQG